MLRSVGVRTEVCGACRLADGLAWRQNVEGKGQYSRQRLAVSSLIATWQSGDRALGLGQSMQDDPEERGEVGIVAGHEYTVALCAAYVIPKKVGAVRGGLDQFVGRFDGAVLTELEAVVVRVRPCELDENPSCHEQRGWFRVNVSRGPHLSGELGQIGSRDCAEKCVFAGEVSIRRSARNVCCGGNCAQGDRVGPSTREKSVGCRD